MHFFNVWGQNIVYAQHRRWANQLAVSRTVFKPISPTEVGKVLSIDNWKDYKKTTFHSWKDIRDKPTLHQKDFATVLPASYQTITSSKGTQNHDVLPELNTRFVIIYSTEHCNSITDYKVNHTGMRKTDLITFHSGSCPILWEVKNWKPAIGSDSFTFSDTRSDRIDKWLFYLEEQRKKDLLIEAPFKQLNPVYKRQLIQGWDPKQFRVTEGDLETIDKKVFWCSDQLLNFDNPFLLRLRLLEQFRVEQGLSVREMHSDQNIMNFFLGINDFCEF